MPSVARLLFAFAFAFHAGHALGASTGKPESIFNLCLQAIGAEGLTPDLIPGSTDFEDPWEPMFDSDPGRRQTLNGTGFESRRWDKITSRFVDFAHETRDSHPIFLDVGTAYGRVAVAAARHGATVVANDIDSRHLDEMVRTLPPDLRGRMALHGGAFPEQMTFNTPIFRAIRISRVLHFFSGERITQALKKCYELLEPGGKLFIVAATPYIAMLKDFLPEFERRRMRGDRWPGFIADLPAIYPPALGVYPKELNALDPMTLLRALFDAGFRVESSEWLRNPDMPLEQVLDGRELVGAVAIKP